MPFIEAIKKNSKFILFALLLFAIVITIEIINKRFWLYDFKVYYLAVKSFLSGGEVYGVPFGLSTGFYKYSPFVLITFMPSAVFSYETAAVIHFIVMAMCCISSILVLHYIASLTLFQKKTKTEFFFMLLGLVCILNHLVRELHMGNVNVILVLLLSLGILFTIHLKHIWAGICIALAVLIKPYLLILLVPLILHKKIKTVLSTGLSLFIFVSVSFVVLGFSKSMMLHSQWLKAMTEHSSYLYSNHTIPSLIKFYLYSNLPDSLNFYFLGFIVFAYVIIFYFMQKTKPNNIQDTTNLVTSYFVLLAIIPNILITDTEHFLFSLPLIVLVLNFLNEAKSKIYNMVFGIIIVFYNGNSSDIFGSNLYDKFESMGLLGLANIGIISFAIYASVKVRSLEATLTKKFNLLKRN